LYWALKGNDAVGKLVHGAPVYERAIDVPELDKKFFFLDDDNNYEPSLWHHSVTRIDRPKQFYNY